MKCFGYQKWKIYPWNFVARDYLSEVVFMYMQNKGLIKNFAYRYLNQMLSTALVVPGSILILGNVRDNLLKRLKLHY